MRRQRLSRCTVPGLGGRFLLGSRRLRSRSRMPRRSAQAIAGKALLQVAIPACGGEHASVLNRFPLSGSYSVVDEASGRVS
jgi:hypothetical protein